VSPSMEGLLHYINPAHAISLLSALNEERLKGQLCDVLLIVGDQKFRAHKNVLAASSEYFQSLFTNQENESQTVFQLDFCEPDAFDNVLNYIYSSSLFVEKGSLAAVQELGYSLGISFLTNIASKTPQAPFPTCPNRKKPFAEDDENSSQKRSVIADFPGSGLSKDEFAELEGARPNKKFKCKHCLKIFRSTAGLHRHVNMYHNPEKPYACDICHKRFHTNFKVWTHCQTQHGIRKLIDIVREREIKKALILKLRRGRPGFQGPGGSPAQAIKRSLRSRAKGAYLERHQELLCSVKPFICHVCNKAFRTNFRLWSHFHPTGLPENPAPSADKLFAARESDTLFYHAPPLSAITFKRQFMCKLCHRTFKTAFSLWSHEQTHS
ncbi:hypothetical protein E2I00_002454, partial [Balaenoptera physalus]